MPKLKFKKPKIKPLKLHLATVPIILLVILLILSLVAFETIFSDKIFPRVFVGSSNLTYFTKDQAYRVLDAQFSKRLEDKLQFSYGQKNYEIDLATASADININQSVDEAWSIGHQGNLLNQIQDQLNLIIFGQTITPNINLSIDNQLKPISKEVFKSPKEASLTFNEATSSSTISAQIKVVEGSGGFDIDTQKIQDEVKKYIAFGQVDNYLPIKTIPPQATTENVQQAKKLLEEAINNPAKLVTKDNSWTIDVKTLITLINLTQPQVIDNSKVVDYLKDLSEKVNQPVVEGQFNFDSSNQRVIAFKPSQEGRALDINTTASLITLALEGKSSKVVTLPINTVQPKVTTESVNNLGIKELIGEGVSNFAGSIPNRIYNVGLAASRINGTLVPPGEIFSFNKTVGDISGASGYKQAYVINNGRTVLDDGGGVCQDSTTLFRAVLNAGLPVVARTGHAYRVGYYEQGFPPGLDATVFSPSVDFQFKNDTASYILVQTTVSGTTLYVDLYGTSDGRVSTLSKPVISNQTPPPPDLRQDDPTLPKGTVKQVDFSAWGANVTFYRTVTRTGQTLISETYHTNYKPWQAIYLVGTQ